MNGWTEDKTVKAMVLLGEEIASQITPEPMLAVQMPEYSIIATVEFACRTELKRRGGGEYRESHSTLSPSSYTCVCIFCGQNFYGETLADCMIAAMENTT